MKWISVEDELPAWRTEVLISQHCYMDKKNPRYILIACLDKGSEWTVETQEGVREDVYPPTHWMPLPEPPEEA